MIAPEPEDDGLQTFGLGPSGYPVRGRRHPGPLRDEEVAALPMRYRPSVLVFRTWDDAERARYEGVLRQVAEGRLLLWHRDYLPDPEGQGWRILLEVVAPYHDADVAPGGGR